MCDRNFLSEIWRLRRALQIFIRRAGLVGSILQSSRRPPPPPPGSEAERTGPSPAGRGLPGATAPSRAPADRVTWVRGKGLAPRSASLPQSVLRLMSLRRGVSRCSHNEPGSARGCAAGGSVRGRPPLQRVAALPALRAWRPTGSEEGTGRLAAVHMRCLIDCQ